AYYLVSQETIGGDRWYDINTAVQTTADGAITQGAYYYGGWYTMSGLGHTYGPLNFAYVMGGSAPPPPPPTGGSPPPSGGTPFVTGQSLGTPRHDFNGWVGMQIRTGSGSLAVTGVGRIVAPGNSGSHAVKIVDAATWSDVPGCSAVVS